MTRIWGALARIPVPVVAALLVAGGAAVAVHDALVAHWIATGDPEWPQWVGRLTVQWYWAVIRLAVLALWARRRSDQGLLGRSASWLCLVGGPVQYGAIAAATLVWGALCGCDLLA